MLATPTASSHHVVARGEAKSSDGGDTEHHERGTPDRTGGASPDADEPHRSDPGVVGAADAVAVVVGVVHADLEGEAHDEGQRQPPPRDIAGSCR